MQKPVTESTTPTEPYDSMTEFVLRFVALPALIIIVAFAVSAMVNGGGG